MTDKPSDDKKMAIVDTGTGKVSTVHHQYNYHATLGEGISPITMVSVCIWLLIVCVTLYQCCALFAPSR